MLLTAITLNKNIDCNKLCEMIISALNKQASEGSMENKVLSISLNSIIDSQTITKPLLIEYKT